LAVLQLQLPHFLPWIVRKVQTRVKIKQHPISYSVVSETGNRIRILERANSRCPCSSVVNVLGRHV